MWVRPWRYQWKKYEIFCHTALSKTVLCKWETPLDPAERQTIGERIYVRADLNSEFADIESVSLDSMTITKNYETTQVVGPNANLNMMGKFLYFTLIV